MHKIIFHCKLRFEIGWNNETIDKTLFKLERDSLVCPILPGVLNFTSNRKSLLKLSFIDNDAINIKRIIQSIDFHPKFEREIIIQRLLIIIHFMLKNFASHCDSLNLLIFFSSAAMSICRDWKIICLMAKEASGEKNARNRNVHKTFHSLINLWP